jgi:hypothetical protein
MSSPARPGRNRGAVLLNVAAGDYGSLPNLALFIAALFVTLCVLPAGAPFALFLALRDLAALGHAPTEDIPDWLIRDALMWSGIVILAYFFEKAVIRVRAIILRSLVVSAITFFAVAISLGAPQWFAGGDSPTLLAFGSASQLFYSYFFGPAALCCFWYFAAVDIRNFWCPHSYGG